MRDDDLRARLAAYAEAAAAPGPAPSQIRARAGRRRTARLGGVAVLGVAAVVAAVVSVPQLVQRQAPVAAPAPSLAPPTSTPTPPVMAGLTCTQVAVAWDNALAARPVFPASLGPDAWLRGVLPTGQLVASAWVGDQQLTAVYPAGVEVPLVSVLTGAGETAAALAADATTAVFFIGAQAADDSDPSPGRLVVVDGPGAPPRILLRGFWLRSSADLATMRVRTHFHIADGKLRWLDWPQVPGPDAVLRLGEVPLNETDTVATTRTLGRIDATMPFVVWKDLLLRHTPDGAWEAVNLGDLAPATLPPGWATTLDGATRGGVPSGRDTVIFYLGDDPHSAAWEYDPATGGTRQLATDVRWASAYQNLVVAHTVDGWLLRDLTTGHTVPLATQAEQPILLGDPVVLLAPAPAPSPQTPGTVIDWDTLPHSIPNC